MDINNIRLMKEPECWCGPNSILEEPNDFREVDDDHFRLDNDRSRDIQRLIDDRCVYDHPSQSNSTFIIRGTSENHRDKQKRLMEEMDRKTKQLYEDKDQLARDVQDLWKLNNVCVILTLDNGVRSIRYRVQP